LIGQSGWIAFFGILMTAYSLGGGTYTGIEAVANGMNTLREPKVKTGKRTMLYMAISLAITAGGILICYMLWDVRHVPGKTLNAVLIEGVFGTWTIWGIPFGKGLIFLTLLSEALLLFIAAQAGFIAGPTVLSNMAVDSYMPHRFANLSSRLVRLNGLLLMGVAALAILWFTKGNVGILVVLYSINVFITFSLSQLAMIRHWLQVREQRPDWWWRCSINGVGLMLTGLILVVTTVIKFGQGGWATLVITGGVVALALLSHKHYVNVWAALKRLDDMLINLPFPEAPPVETPMEPSGPTAVILVNNYNGLGIHSIFSVRKLFKQQDFKNMIFISVGRIDSSKFKGVEEIENLKHDTEEGLKKYVSLARSMGYSSEYRMSMGIDVIPEIEKMCDDISADYVEPIFFAGKLIFAQENLLTKWLHNQTALELQRRLLFKGHNMVVVPIRVL
jgi:hypothetical protein